MKKPSKTDRMNKDVIVYCATDHGIDGREVTKVMYAALHEDQLKALIAADPNKAWRQVEKRIVNLAYLKIEALAKLDGIEKLALKVA